MLTKCGIFFWSKYTQWRYFFPTLLLTKTRGVTCIVGETLCNILWSRKKVWKCSFKFFNQNDITQIYGFFFPKFWHDSQLGLFSLLKFLKLWRIHIFFIFVSIQKYITYFYYPIINTPFGFFFKSYEYRIAKSIALRWMAKNLTTQFTINCKRSCYPFKPVSDKIS